MRLIRLVIFLMSVAALALATGCPQGEGDRCEAPWDCDDGLVCCTGSKTCQKSCTTSQHDAAVQRDAAASTDASPL